jgi:ankyrin repeat protein
MRKTITITVMTLALCAMNVEAKSISNRMEFPLKVEKTIGLSSFCNAIFKGDLQTVKSMIALGEDVNQKSLGMTPAIFAARYNKAEILELLVANGAKLKVKCDRGIGIKEYAEASNAMEALKVINENWKK